MRTAILLGLLFALAGLSGCVQPLGLRGGDDLPASLLRDDAYPDLIVEVDHVKGHAPCPKALNAMEGALLALTDKRRVVVTTNVIEARGGGYDNKELGAIHEAENDHGPTDAGRHGRGEAAHLHVIFLDGRAKATHGGHAAGRTLHDEGAIFVFPDTYAGAYSLTGGLRRDASCDVERTVLLHELGHAFGLVNRGVPMLHDREADGRAGHSTNPDSVMYPVLRLGRDGLLLGDLPRGFDEHDVDDLLAFTHGGG